MDLDISSHICGYDILSKFDFQCPGLKVKVDMTEIIFYHVRSNPFQPENLNVYNDGIRMVYYLQKDTPCN